MLTSDKAKLAAIARDLETLLREMVAMREDTRALTALLTRVAEKVEANVERTPDGSAGRTSGHV
jgi:hypothetical protein